MRDVIEMRQYAAAKAAVESAKREEDATEWQKTTVMGVKAELIRRRKAKLSGR